jgi:hypothetical protein
LIRKGGLAHEDDKSLEAPIFRGEMRRWLKDNGLSVAMVTLFFVCWVGQALAGYRHHCQEQQEHRQSCGPLRGYLGSGDFLEATFENWESEFFQMAAFLILSSLLMQRGAAESRKPDDQQEKEDELEEKGLHAPPADAPGPVHRGGLALQLYSRSLSIALAGLFAISFVMHGIFGLRRFNDDAQAHGSPSLTLAGYFTSSTFWFESFQNWQSEFLSIAALVLLSIFLRQKGSPESKPVHAPHHQTGTS